MVFKGSPGGIAGLTFVIIIVSIDLSKHEFSSFQKSHNSDIVDRYVGNGTPGKIIFVALI